MPEHLCGVQDRHQNGGRTPRWRGVTLLHELRSHGIPVALASDNTRDQFFAYGDLDMLEVFNQVLHSHKPASAKHLPKHVRSRCSILVQGCLMLLLAAGTAAFAIV